MNNDYQHVLLRLREERERQNLTQRLLCYRMRIQQSHFSKAETGHRYFTYQELEGLCTSDVDVLYVFTGKRAVGQKFPEPQSLDAKEAICCLNTVYTLTHTAWFMHRDNPSFELIQQNLRYIPCGNEKKGIKSNIFFYVRNCCGYTQQKMADILGVDIKKLRELEKGRLLPDSGLIWKMYDRFHVSPAFILKDARGLWNELNYVLDLMDAGDRTIILRILENEHKLLRNVSQRQRSPRNMTRDRLSE